MLDLFAGSGALAIEALSRGAAAATLVDSAGPAVAAIRRNLEALGIEAEVVRQPAARFLQGARATRVNTISSSSTPHTATRAPSDGSSRRHWRRCSHAEARVVAESDRRSPLELELALLDERRYGDTLIQIHAAR